MRFLDPHLTRPFRVKMDRDIRSRMQGSNLFNHVFGHVVSPFKIIHTSNFDMEVQKQFFPHATTPEIMNAHNGWMMMTNQSFNFLDRD